MSCLAGVPPAVADPRNAIRNDTDGSFEMTYKCDVSDHDNNSAYNQVWSAAFPELVAEGCECEFDRRETHGQSTDAEFAAVLSYCLRACVNLACVSVEHCREGL